MGTSASQTTHADIKRCINDPAYDIEVIEPIIDWSSFKIVPTGSPKGIISNRPIRNILYDYYSSAVILVDINVDIIVFDEDGYAMRYPVTDLLRTEPDDISIRYTPLIAIRYMPFTRKIPYLTFHVHNGRFCIYNCCFACGHQKPAAYCIWGHLIKPICAMCLRFRKYFESLVQGYWVVRLATGVRGDVGFIIFQCYQGIMRYHLEDHKPIFLLQKKFIREAR